MLRAGLVAFLWHLCAFLCCLRCSIASPQLAVPFQCLAKRTGKGIEVHRRLQGVGPWAMFYEELTDLGRKKAHPVVVL